MTRAFKKLVEPKQAATFKSSKKSRKGVAALEFLFAAPAFFVLVFFVIEIALIWNDRHLMRLAAYRAGKVVLKHRSHQGTNDHLCWVIPGAGGVIDPQSQKIHTTAKS